MKAVTARKVAQLVIGIACPVNVAVQMAGSVHYVVFTKRYCLHSFKTGRYGSTATERWSIQTCSLVHKTTVDPKRAFCVTVCLSVSWQQI